MHILLKLQLQVQSTIKIFIWSGKKSQEKNPWTKKTKFKWTKKKWKLLLSALIVRTNIKEPAIFCSNFLKFILSIFSNRGFQVLIYLFWLIVIWPLFFKSVVSMGLVIFPNLFFFEIELISKLELDFMGKMFDVWKNYPIIWRLVDEKMRRHKKSFKNNHREHLEEVCLKLFYKIERRILQSSRSQNDSKMVQLDLLENKVK